MAPARPPVGPRHKRPRGGCEICRCASARSSDLARCRENLPQLWTFTTPRGLVSLALEGKASHRIQVLGHRSWPCTGTPRLWNGNCVLAERTKSEGMPPRLGIPSSGIKCMDRCPATGHGLHLTAHRMAFKHPIADEEIDAVAPPARKMKRAVPSRFHSSSMPASRGSRGSVPTDAVPVLTFAALPCAPFEPLSASSCSCFCPWRPSFECFLAWAGWGDSRNPNDTRQWIHKRFVRCAAGSAHHGTARVMGRSIPRPSRGPDGKPAVHVDAVLFLWAFPWCTSGESNQIVACHWMRLVTAPFG